MLRVRPALALTLALLALFAAPANAADPTPTPTPTAPPPTPSPAASLSPSPSAAVSPSASPSSSPSPLSSAALSPSPSASTGAANSPVPSGSPSPSPTTSASPSPEPAPTTQELEAARERDAQLLANARSLTQIIEAQALVATDELAALKSEIANVSKELETVGAEIGALEAQTQDRRAIRDRTLRDAFRLAASSATPLLPSLSEAQREAYQELLDFDAALRAAHARLSERAAQLASAQQAAAAKEGQLTRLRDRARVIAAAAAKGEGERRAAEVAVLQSLARDAAAAQTSLAQLVATAMATDGVAPSSWILPVRGTITQAFGPSTFALALPRTYRGVHYPHFHDAIDIAARLGQPVVAAAEGRVTYAGHLSDGAMVVIVSHTGGLVSVYAHLDDTFARPPVRAGDTVKAGQVVGFVGLTGITTGPHLHFSVLRGAEPVDPLSLIAAR